MTIATYFRSPTTTTGTNTEPSGTSSSSNGKSEEKSLSAILLGMSALFIACQSLKIVPDLYELIVCHQTLHKVGHHCKMDGPVSILLIHKEESRLSIEIGV